MWGATVYRRLARKAFRRTSGTSSEPMEAQRQPTCRPQRWWPAVERLMSRLFHDPTNWKFPVERRLLMATSNKVSWIDSNWWNLIWITLLLESNLQYKSFSLTGQNAAQLSQSVKERFGTGTNSLPKPGLDMHVFHARLAQVFSTFSSSSITVSLWNFFLCPFTNKTFVNSSPLPTPSIEWPIVDRPKWPTAVSRILIPTLKTTARTRCGWSIATRRAGCRTVVNQSIASRSSLEISDWFSTETRLSRRDSSSIGATASGTVWNCEVHS